MTANQWGEVTRLEPLLDAAEQAERRPAATLHQAALWYAEQRLPVFPLRPGAKVPATRHGVHDATTDPKMINQWWQRTPAANIGVATGFVFDAVDIDGPDGIRSWLDAWDEFAELDQVGMVNTPRPGGRHLWVPASGEGNRAGLLPGIDYRGRGGYVVAPPSVITAEAGGEHPGTYSWLRPYTPAVSGAVAA